MRLSLPFTVLLVVAVAGGEQALVARLPAAYGLATSDLILAILAGYASVGYARLTRRESGRARVAVAIGTVSAGLWSLANVLFLLARASLISEDAISVGSTVAGVAAFLLPVGLIMAVPPIKSLARLRRFIDVAAVSGAVFILAWQFILAPASAALDGGSVLISTLTIAAESLAVALALVMAATSVPSAGARSLHLLAAVALILAVTAMLGVRNNMTQVPWYEHGVAGGYVLGAMLMAVASHHAVPLLDRSERRQLVSNLWAILPYIPVISAVVAVALVQLRTGQLGPVLVWLMLGTFCLVLLRQLTTLLLISRMAAVLHEQKAELAKQAHHDALTGLPNRVAFHDHGARALRGTGQVVVMLLDLDGFKQVNDSLGHAAGDEVLVTVAHRLTTSLRPADVTCRLGGDEFAVLLTDVSDDVVTHLAGRALSAIHEPMTVQGEPVTVGVSIGVASAPAAGAVTLDVLLQKADEAMYAAKAHGKGKIYFHPQPVAS